MTESAVDVSTTQQTARTIERWRNLTFVKSKTVI